MLRSVSFAALVLSLALNFFAPVGVAAHDGSDSSVSAESPMISLPAGEGRTISESSGMLLIGFALIIASRLARR